MEQNTLQKGKGKGKGKEKEREERNGETADGGKEPEKDGPFHFHPIRITPNTRFTTLITHALVHLLDPCSPPVLFHSLPQLTTPAPVLSQSDSSPAESSKAQAQAQRKAENDSVSTIPRLISMVEIVKREYERCLLKVAEGDLGHGDEDGRDKKRGQGDGKGDNAAAKEKAMDVDSGDHTGGEIDLQGEEAGGKNTDNSSEKAPAPSTSGAAFAAPSGSAATIAIKIMMEKAQKGQVGATRSDDGNEKKKRKRSSGDDDDDSEETEKKGGMVDQEGNNGTVQKAQPSKRVRLDVPLNDGEDSTSPTTMSTSTKGLAEQTTTDDPTSKTKCHKSGSNQQKQTASSSLSLLKSHFKGIDRLPHHLHQYNEYGCLEWEGNDGRKEILRGVGMGIGATLGGRDGVASGGDCGSGSVSNKGEDQNDKEKEKQKGMGTGLSLLDRIGGFGNNEEGKGNDNNNGKGKGKGKGKKSQKKGKTKAGGGESAMETENGNDAITSNDDVGVGVGERGIATNNKGGSSTTEVVADGGKNPPGHLVGGEKGVQVMMDVLDGRKRPRLHHTPYLKIYLSPRPIEFLKGKANVTYQPPPLKPKRRRSRKQVNNKKGKSDEGENNAEDDGDAEEPDRMDDDARGETGREGEKRVEEATMQVDKGLS